MATRDKIAAGMLVATVTTNLVVSETEWADSICITFRNVFHTDTVPGKIVATATCLAFTGWFIPHFIFGPLERRVVD